MRTLSTLLARPAWAVGVSAALALGCVLLGGLWLYGEYRAATHRIDRVEPRYARLAGLEAAAASLDAALAKANARSLDLAYPASLDAAQAGAAMQKAARELAESAGLTVSGSRLLPATSGPGFDEFRVTLKVDGSLTALNQLLLAVDKQKPAIRIGALQVMPDPRIGSSELGHRISAEVAFVARRFAT